MVQSARPPANNFVRLARKVYNPVGFAKGYNFVLYFIFAGALTGFILARLQFLNIDGIFCARGTANGALPGECYWYLNNMRHRVGIVVHLATILPAGLIAVLQFTPAIRHNFILYHRMAGYVAILLSIVSTVCALMIADRTFGGDIMTQTFVGFLGVAFLFALGMALTNIRLKQIEQHRAWMLRAWFWAASIITLRIIMLIQVNIISASSYFAGNAFYASFPCKQMLWTMVQFNNSLAAMPQQAQEAYLGGQYPTCIGQFDSEMVAAPVRADFNGGVLNVAASFHISFATAGVLAWMLHAFGVEAYLKLTTRESERMRMGSYKKQLEAGFKNPGSAGLVPERFGDVDPWVPPQERKTSDTNDRNESTSPAPRKADV